MNDDDKQQLLIAVITDRDNAEHTFQ